MKNSLLKIGMLASAVAFVIALACGGPSSNAQPEVSETDNITRAIIVMTSVDACTRDMNRNAACGGNSSDGDGDCCNQGGTGPAAIAACQSCCLAYCGPKNLIPGRHCHDNCTLLR